MFNEHLEAVPTRMGDLFGDWKITHKALLEIFHSSTYSFYQGSQWKPLNFSDILVNKKYIFQYISKNILKATDSNHPKSCKKNIPFCLASRICTIVESTSMKLIKLEKLKTTMISQRYPHNLIEKGIEKALSILQNLRSP